MIGRATFIWMLLAIAAGIGLFVLKYEVRSMEEEVVRINHETLVNLETVHVLKAEWSYLNRPARLEDLGRRLLSLEPTEATQSAAIGDIPMRLDTPGPTPDGLDTRAPTQPSVASETNSPAAGQVPPLLATYRRAQ